VSGGRQAVSLAGTGGLVGNRHLQIARCQCWNQVALTEMLAVAEPHSLHQGGPALFSLAGPDDLHHLLADLPGDLLGHLRGDLRGDLLGPLTGQVPRGGRSPCPGEEFAEVRGKP